MTTRHIWNDIELLATANACYVTRDTGEECVQMMHGDHLMRQFNHGRAPFMWFRAGMGRNTAHLKDIFISSLARPGQDVCSTCGFQHQTHIHCGGNVADQRRTAGRTNLFIIVDYETELLILRKTGLKQHLQGVNAHDNTRLHVNDTGAVCTTITERKRIAEGRTGGINGIDMSHKEDAPLPQAATTGY